MPWINLLGTSGLARTALDTNILVRLITRDDPAQLARCEALLSSVEAVVYPTVLLETEWVLRRAFRYGRIQIAESLEGLMALSGFTIIDADRVSSALEWFGAGMDFADALHLAGSSDCDELVTFDRDFARLAQDAPDAIPVRLL